MTHFDEYDQDLGRRRPKRDRQPLVTPPPRQFWDGAHAICPYCQGKALLVQFKDPGYPYARDWGQVWACPCPAKAYVGVHRGTNIPLGRLADADLRNARRAAHAAFDPLWQRRADRGQQQILARTDEYRKLARALGIPARECHIGWFDVEQCERVTHYAASTDFEALA